MEFRTLNKRSLGFFGHKLVRFSSVIVFIGLTISSANALDLSDKRRVNYVKTAFVFNIARFVSWPKEAFVSGREAHTLCLYRYNRLGKAVETLTSKRLQSFPVKIKIVESLKDSDRCTILFLTHRELSRFSEEAEEYNTIYLLTVADITARRSLAGMAHPGVMVSLVRKDAKIRLEVDREQAMGGGLRISAQLLKLAKIVSKNN